MFFGKHQSFTTILDYNENPVWRESFHFDYETKLQQIARERLKIKLLDRDKSTLGKVKINLIEISTGPTHFDYKIIKDSRIFFDIVMTQEVEF